MERLAIGSVVLIPFPFSDLTKSKLRPAIVLASTNFDDWIFCQVTSNPYSDPSAIKITATSFKEGSLGRISYARPTKIFTGNIDLVIRKVGILNFSAVSEIANQTIAIFQQALKNYS